MKPYPNTLYVYRENEGEENEFLQESETLNGTAALDENRVVAVYELKEIVEVTTQVKVRKID